MAADQGNASGQLNYGVCLKNGLGVAQDFEKAATYFRMAADQGNPDAAQSLRRLTERLKNPKSSLG
jgi:TPR repeat protein